MGDRNGPGLVGSQIDAGPSWRLGEYTKPSAVPPYSVIFLPRRRSARRAMPSGRLMCRRAPSPRSEQKPFGLICRIPDQRSLTDEATPTSTSQGDDNMRGAIIALFPLMASTEWLAVSPAMTGVNAQEQTFNLTIKSNQFEPSTLCLRG
jgi:hypothetical protein